jgi:miniconductance mechanosensitive channel
VRRFSYRISFSSSCDFLQCHLFLQSIQLANYIVTAAMIVILLVIIWTIIALLSVFDDILSKSPVFEGKPITSYIQVLNIAVYFS